MLIQRPVGTRFVASWLPSQAKVKLGPTGSFGRDALRRVL